MSKNNSRFTDYFKFTPQHLVSDANFTGKLAFNERVLKPTVRKANDEHYFLLRSKESK